jgi:hypothetical protein
MLKKLLVALSLTATLAHAEFISSKITPELKTKIKNQTGLVVNDNIGATVIYSDSKGMYHYVLIEGSDELDNELSKQTKELKSLYQNSSIQYPVKKYYVRIKKRINTNGYIDLEYEIMLARSYDGDLGAKNRKYLNVLLATGAGVFSGGINPPREEHVYTYPELGSPHMITGVGDVIKNVTLDVNLDDPDNAVVIEDYSPQNINPNTKVESKSRFTVDFRNVKKFAIPIPLPSWNWEHSFSFDSAMYQINSIAKDNVLAREFIWELNGNPRKWAYNDTEQWSCDILYFTPQYNCPTYSYYSIDKVKMEGYLYDFKPTTLVRYSANPDYNGKSELWLGTHATVGRMLASAKYEIWTHFFSDTIRALNNRISFEFNDYSSYKVNTLTTVDDVQHLTIDWSSPVFEQFYPTTYKFIKDNVCLTNRSDKVIASECLTATDDKYHTQKWLFDSDNKLIRSFDNVDNCITYQNGEFILSKCDVNLSENSWFNKLPNDQNYKLYYKDKFITVINGKLGLATTAKDVLVKLDNY